MSFDSSSAQNKKRSRGNSIFDNEIVISGMSGKFPNSKTIEQFEYNLYNKVDMVDDAETRWKHGIMDNGIPRRMGKINDIDKFDATFFGVHYKQAQSMDPLCRLIMETAYEAVLDAGINPKVLRGTKTGVFVAACQSETEQIDFTEKMALGDFGITGTSRSMIANRISYALGLHGPSMIIDSACSSSMYALDAAFNAIKHGECDAAIVGGTNLLLYPHVTLQLVGLGNLSPNGNCRPFDNDANGTVRSEAICAILLQRSKDAKRVYGTIVASRTNYDGFKCAGITAASATSKTCLLEEIYNDNGISADNLAYLETHGTGIAADDMAECQAIENVLCENRQANNQQKKPLLIGSVKSNMGHAEACSSLASIVKVLLAFERGVVAPNINFSKININSMALVTRQLKVCQQATPLDGGLYIGINSFGYAGANAHVVLKRHLKEKSTTMIENDDDDQQHVNLAVNDLPRLVKWAGRTEEAINVFHEKMESIPLDLEYIGLLNNIQCEEIAGFFYRGYGLYRNGNTVNSRNTNTNNNNSNAYCLAKDLQRFTGMQRPIVWVFSGMGSQWNKMGESLLQLSVFRESLQKSHNALHPYGVDLLNIVTSTDECIFKNILNSFIGIAAIQIGCVDTLRALDMDADLYIGHSFGELACAYADGCFTLEQTILSAYYRGLASLETKTINGAIAAIGLGYREVKNRLPSTLEVACHNGPDSSTISGPKEDIEQFVAQLKSEQIFAKEIYVANIAYHSRYIANMGPNLQRYLDAVIPSPRKRSSKWLSTSVPKMNWDIAENQYSSAQYHTNNLLNFVLFEETASFLPSNCITMEIAPHGLLQPVLKKLLPNGLHVPLTLKGSNDNIGFFFNALGKLYLSGVSVPIENLYAPVQYPVSRGTPMISPMIRWEHATDWYVEKYQHHKNICNGERKIEMSLDDPQYKYIAGNVVDGRCFIPCTGYLHLVWETFAMMLDKRLDDVSVEFEDVKMTERTTMKPGEIVKLTVMILSGTGSFEINDQLIKLTVSTGIIRELEKSETTIMEDSGAPVVMVNETTANSRQHPPPPHQTNLPFINGDDFYRELRLRGYQYADAFRGVCETRGDGCVGRVKWQNNWVTFLDSILQAIMLGQDTRQLGFLTGFQKITINVKQHRAVLETLDKFNPIFDLQYVPQLGAVVSAGIEISGMSVVSVAKSKPLGINLIESYEYLPYLMMGTTTTTATTTSLDMTDAINVFLQIILENNNVGAENKLLALELLQTDEPIIQYLNDAIERQPLQTIPDYNLTLLTTSNQFNFKSSKIDIIKLDEYTNGGGGGCGNISVYKNYDIIIARNCFAANPNTIQNYRQTLKNTFASYLIARETIDIDLDHIKNIPGFELISIIPTTFDETILLFQKCCVTSMRLLSPIESPSDTTSKTVNILRITTGDDQYKWLNKLQNMIKANQSILLLAENEEYSGALGLVKCLHREFENKRDIQLMCIEDDSAPSFDIHLEFYRQQLNKNLLINIYRNGQWGHYAYFPMDTQQEQPHKNNIAITENVQSQIDNQNDYYFGMLLERGDLTSLKWCPGIPDYALLDKTTPTLQSDIVNVQYVGLNFRDLLYATGQFGPEIMTLERLQQERILCTDYAGINCDTGERIMGMLKYGALTTQIQQSSPPSDDQFTWIVPKHWTLRDAVTCPTAYLTVYIAYFMYNPIAKGKSILIHCGSGGIGLAAIHIALAYGMDVYTTVSSQEKKLFLLETFPELKENNIGNSRDCSFELMIKFQTHGLGVDYVLNQLAGERLHASIRCLGYGGTLLEIGSFDMFNDNKIGLGCFLRNLLFRSVSVYNYITLPSADEDRLRIIGKIQNDLNAGIIQPLPSTEFMANDLVNAVAYLTTGKHMGKIVIKLRAEPNDKCTLPMEIAPRINFNSMAVFVVAGGFGEFGLEFIDWMIIRGARKFIINSKTGLTQPFQLYRVRLWESYGCKIIQNALDITSLKNVETLICEGLALGGGEIDGIFNLTMHFREQSLLDEQSNSYYECIAPKLLGTKYLDELSRKMCPKLKWFIVFSSVASGRGDIDSSGYGLANSAMEQIIEKRQTLGLPAMAIQWSGIEEIGYTSKQVDARANMNRKGYELQRVELCLKNLDRMLTPTITRTGSLINTNTNTKNRKAIIAAIVSSISIVDRNA